MTNLMTALIVHRNFKNIIVLPLFLFLFVLCSDELERHEDFFVNLAIQLLAAYKVLIFLSFFGIDPFPVTLPFLYHNVLGYVQKELEPSITHIGTFVENLKNLSQG